jgi:hypothetical protein
MVLGILLLISFIAMLGANRKVLLFGVSPYSLAAPLSADERFETYWAQNCRQIAGADFRKFDCAIVDLSDQPDACIHFIAYKIRAISPNAIMMRSAKPTPETARHMAQIAEWQKGAPYRYFRWIFYFALCGFGTILVLDLFETIHGRKNNS